MNTKQTVIRVILLIFTVSIIYLISTYLLNSDFLINNNSVKIIEDNWTYNGKTIDLSNKSIEVGAREKYTIKNQLPKSTNNKDNFILLRSSLSNVEVHVDNKVIYKSYNNNQGLFKVPMASLWHLVELPNAGEVLSITYESPYKKMSGRLNDVVHGYKSDLLIYIAIKYGPSFTIDFLILFVGILILFIALISPIKFYDNISNLGSLSILIALWLISESRMLQFFSNSLWLHGSLAYITLAIIPLPLILYIQNVVTDKSKKILAKAIPVSLANLALIIAFQLLDISDFFQTVWITHLYMVLLVLLIFKILYFEVKVLHNNLAIRFISSLSILFIFFLVEMVRFYTLDAANITIFIRIGLLLFIIMLTLDAVKQIIRQIKKSYQVGFYEKLAYIDQLTQGPNRMAFIRDIDKIFLKSKEGTRLIILDVNNLKNINDIHGHIMGDDAIQKAYEVIDNCFKSGTTYRIGGDEFACILPKQSENEFLRSCNTFKSKVSEINEETVYSFGIAIGSVVYDKNIDLNASDMIQRADIKMYQDKNKIAIN